MDIVQKNYICTIIDLSTDLGTDMSYPRTTSARRPLGHQYSSQMDARQMGARQMGACQIDSHSLNKGAINLTGNRLASSNSNLRPVDSSRRRLVQQSASSSAPVLSPIWKDVFAKRAAWIGVGAIALSLLAVVPMRVDSESIDLSSCEKKIEPTGAISRGQLSALLALPAGANREAVRAVISEPYCTLPAISESAGSAKKLSEREKSAEASAIAGAYRDAYPLAFDPEAWVVVAYTSAEEYAGYDFVFKP